MNRKARLARAYSAFIIAACLLSSLLFAGCPFPGPPSDGEVTKFDLGSSYGTDYAIQVWTPPDLGAGEKIKTLYVLDGDEAFNSSACEASDLIVDGYAPLLVVGIGYGSGTNERTRDYTPTYSAAEGDGGGIGAFLGFVVGSLIPRVEAEYPAVADRSGRILNGHSFGGLAALEALFTQSNNFSACMASSPSLWWDGNVMFDRLNAFLASAASAQASRLFVSVGSHEGDGMDALFLVFAQRMAAAPNPPIAFMHEIIPGKRHWDSRYTALRDALPFVLGGSR